MISGSNIPGTPTAAASANVNSNGSVVGGGDDSGGGEGTMVTLLRTALARVRLEEDRTVRAEIRAGLMSLADPSSALPVSLGGGGGGVSGVVSVVVIVLLF